MIDLLIILMYLFLAATLAATVWAVVRRLRMVGKTSGKLHGIAVRKINLSVEISVAVILVLSCLIGSTDAIHINTKLYSDTFWLRAANMFVFTGVTAIVVAACAMIISYINIIRNHHAPKN